MLMLAQEMIGTLQKSNINIKIDILKDVKKNNIDEIYSISLENFLNESWSEKSFVNEIKKKGSNIFIAKHNNKIIGFLASSFCFDININLFAVKKEYQSKGVGYLLFNYLVKYYKKNKIYKIILEVREQNYSAINFYKRNGFLIVGYRKGFYTQPLDNAVLMDFNII